MEQYIKKSALVAEIDRQIELLKPFLGACAGQIVAEANDKLSVLEKLKNFINTLEVKELQEEPIIKETNMYIFITQKIVDYIEEHKMFFENTIPTIKEKWFIEREHTYPNVNKGNPVVEVINDKGEWMRLPKDIVEIFEEPVSEDLEKAASSFARKDSKEISNPANFYYIVADKARIFKAGAEWQKEQMMTKFDLNEKKDIYSQSQWKPSKIQMSALKVASGLANTDMQAILYSLYNDLKKL